jgi:hypothetical protein
VLAVRTARGDVAASVLGRCCDGVGGVSGGVASERSKSDAARLKVLTLRVNTAGMSRKPQQPPQRTRWHVYLQARAAKREWVGEIEAVDEREAIEIAAKEFKQPAKKLMAVVTRLTPEQREALELLASDPHGATEQFACGRPWV